MKLIAVLCCLLVLCVAETESEDGVLVLTDDNFDSEIDKHDGLLVKFYAPWCGHCQTLAPIYVEAANLLAQKNLHIAKLDATIHKKQAARFGITGFPSLKFIRNGVASDYHGARSTEAITAYVKEQSLPLAEEVACEELASKTAAKNLNLVYFGLAEGPHWDLLQNIGKDPISQQFTLLHTSAHCAAQFESTAPGFAVMRGFDEPVVPFTGEVESETLIKFMRRNSVPSMRVFTDQLTHPLFLEGIPAVILFTEEENSALESTFSEVARNYRGNVLELMFLKSGVSSTIEKMLGQVVGLKLEQELPQLFIVKQPRRGEKTKLVKPRFEGLNQDTSVESIDYFVKDFIVENYPRKSRDEL